MQQIDSHQHFWKYHPSTHDWIDDSMSVLKKDYMPDDLKPELEKAGFDGCIAVQASQTEEETSFLLGLAAKYSFIKGVVGWVDLRAANVSDRLGYFAEDKKLCGVRHVVQAEPDDKFMLREDFIKGIKALASYSLCYDILIFPKHLPAAIELVKKFPDQKFVVDHIAKPLIKEGVMEPWALGMKTLAKAPNVYCKLSGMVTEASWSGWKESDFTPYLDIVFESFGPDRLMIGSDWPVCKLGEEYGTVMNIVNNYIAKLSSNEKSGILGGNALKFYNLV